MTGNYTVTLQVSLQSVYSNISTRVLDAFTRQWRKMNVKLLQPQRLHGPNGVIWVFLLALSLWVARAPGLQRSRPHNEKM